MLDVIQFREEIVRPVLKRLGHWSEAAENLVVGTALVESGLTYLRQLGGGPALGLFQMELHTHDDIWHNWLKYHVRELTAVESFMASPSMHEAGESLTWNLGYACAMCRIHYYRRPEALPKPDDLVGLATYWKDHYNTRAGAGHADRFTALYRKHVLGEV